MPPATTDFPNVSQGLYRFSGMYGSAWRNGKLLGDVIEVGGNVDINRIDVPLVGMTRTGHKRGRETRDGTFRVQKMDSAWEIEIYELIAMDLSERRARRDAGNRSGSSFDLHVRYDDPDALAVEEWVLYGCMLWRFTVGFNIGDDLVEREYPFSWESESPIQAFQALQGPTVGSPPTVNPLYNGSKVSGHQVVR